MIIIEINANNVTTTQLTAQLTMNPTIKHTKRKHFVNLFNYFAISKTLIPLSILVLLFVICWCFFRLNHSAKSHCHCDQIVLNFGCVCKRTKNDSICFDPKTVNLCIISRKILLFPLLFAFLLVWCEKTTYNSIRRSRNYSGIFFESLELLWQKQRYKCCFYSPISLSNLVDYLSNQSSIRRQRHQFEARIWHFFDLF